MSEYTIINFVPEYHTAEEFKRPIEFATDSRFVRTRHNNSVVLARVGGDKRSEMRRKLISDQKGELIYDIPIEVGADTGDFLGYLVITYYEDTGDHCETKAYRVIAFEGAEVLDENTIYDDRTGSETEKYYSKRYNLPTAIDPP